MARLILKKKRVGWGRMEQIFLIAIGNLLNDYYVQIYKDYTMDLRTFIEWYPISIVCTGFSNSHISRTRKSEHVVIIWFFNFCPH